LPSLGEGVVIVLLYVVDSFDLTQNMRAHTSGKVSVHMPFQGCQLIEPNPLEQASVAAEVVKKIRARKRIVTLPSLNQLGK
jgi:translation elongation factor EF-G